MKNSKGFTLVELLAVIVVLGILLSIVGVAVVKIKKDANLDQAVQLEADLTKLGESIYSYEITLGEKENTEYFYKQFNNLESCSYEVNCDGFIVNLDELKSAGYLKDITSENKISNPSGGKACDGFILVTKQINSPQFQGYISCPNLYTTFESNEDKSYSSVILKNYPSAKLTIK